MDFLSNVLRDLRLDSAVLSVAELGAPWGVEKGAVEAAPFHVIVEGGCVLEIEGASIRLAAGDLVVLPHGDVHSLLSEPGTPKTPFSRVLEANGLRPMWAPGTAIEGLRRIRFGGAGGKTHVITGVFAFRDHRRNPLLASLPAVIHVHGQQGRAPVWLESALALLMDESMPGRPGFQTIAERAADIVFVHAVRDYLASTSARDAGWLRGLTDPQIARALSQVHGRPGEAWTVSALARSVGLSRTVFAARFRALVGASVMDYVTAQRMHVAAGLLAGSRTTLPDVAATVGYESEISFSKAFRRWAGLPPGQYRRRIAREANGHP